MRELIRLILELSRLVVLALEGPNMDALRPNDHPARLNEEVGRHGVLELDERGEAEIG